MGYAIMFFTYLIVWLVAEARSKYGENGETVRVPLP